MMQDKNFGEELLHKIKDEKILPKPRWQFLLKDYVIWSFGILALFLGSIAISLMIYIYRYNDIGVYGRMGSGLLEETLLIIPFFWIICLGIFIVLVYYNIKHTKKGYRYSPLIILFFIIIASVLLGVIFNIIGFDKKVDDALSRHAPFYDQVMNPRVRFWANPAQGRLTGLIVSQSTTSEFILVDMEKEEWKLFTENAEQDDDAELQIGKPARLLGKTQAEHEFKVIEILPIASGREFFNRFGDNQPKPPLLSPEELNQRGKRGQINRMQNDLAQLFEKYPELRDSFEENLLKEKDHFKKITGNDPEFIIHLKSLNIDPEVVKALQK